MFVFKSPGSIHNITYYGVEFGAKFIQGSLLAKHQKNCFIHNTALKHGPQVVVRHFLCSHVLPMMLSAPIRLKYTSWGKRVLQNLAEVPTGNLFLCNIFRLLTM